MSDDNYMTKANSIWKMLDEMAESNPQSYREFVERQMKEAKSFFSKPITFACLKIAAQRKHTTNEVFINICSWDRVPIQEHDSDPVPVTGGKLFELSPKIMVAVVALNSKTLQHLKTDDKQLENNEMIQLLMDVIESQNDGISLDRHHVEIEAKKFHGNFADLMEKTFPGFAKQMSNPNAAGNDGNDSASLSSIIQSFDVLQELSGSGNDGFPLESENKVNMFVNDVKTSNKASQKVLVEELPSVVSEKQPVEEECEDCSSQVLISYDQKSTPTDKAVVSIELPQNWVLPALKDCYIKRPNKLTVLIQTGGSVKYVHVQLPFCVEETGAAAKYNKKLRTLKITVSRDNQ